MLSLSHCPRTVDLQKLDEDVDEPILRDEIAIQLALRARLDAQRLRVA